MVTQNEMNRGPVQEVAMDATNYWEQSTLALSFSDKKTFSVDTVGAKKHGWKANTKYAHVSQLQKDLVALGYLATDSRFREGLYEESTRRAVLRFQRHAARTYRKPGADARSTREATFSWGSAHFFTQLTSSSAMKGPLLSPDNLFGGRADGCCDFATAQAIRGWIIRGNRNPVGYFSLKPVQVKGATGKLRSDAAAAWENIVRLANQQGAVLDGPYGDTTRVLQKMTKAGTSRFSFHYCGRAVDINQAFGGGKGQRYYISREQVDQSTYWRIYCKTDAQDGTQGRKFEKGEVKYYVFSAKKEADLPAGYYVDLTDLIEAQGSFERIKAQSGWEQTYTKTEWWHFQYKVDKQETFLDEMELIGYSEKQLREAGWNTDDVLDHPPG